MPSALSIDLRECVVAAIEVGTSRRAAAKRFGVGAASAIRWHEKVREGGRIAPRPMGGDQRSRAIGEADGPGRRLSQPTAQDPSTKQVDRAQL